MTDIFLMSNKNVRYIKNISLEEKMIRPKKKTTAVSISFPDELLKLVREIGLGSPSLGIQEIWRRIKDDEQIMKKIRGEK